LPLFFYVHTKNSVYLFNKTIKMLNNIKSEFTIKDLESFSGIKAHTIRIWEKRYSLFTPNRTDSNIRYYNINQLLKLLNISILYKNNLKISKIAAMSEEAIIEEARGFLRVKVENENILLAFKMAMINFDEKGFNDAFNEAVKNMGFREVFIQIFIPFLYEIGNLWQLHAITPAHEHFISHLIKQKIHGAIELLDFDALPDDKPYVLYLPPNEIHDIGLLYLHYELLSSGRKSIYLGQSVPLSNLKDLSAMYNEIDFVTYLTVEPSKESIDSYVTSLETLVLDGTIGKLHIMGAKVQEYSAKFNNVHSYKGVEQFLLGFRENE